MTSQSYLLNLCMRDRTTRELLTTTGTPTETTTAMCCFLWQEASHTTLKKPSPCGSESPAPHGSWLPGLG